MSTELVPDLGDVFVAWYDMTKVVRMCWCCKNVERCFGWVVDAYVFHNVTWPWNKTTSQFWIMENSKMETLDLPWGTHRQLKYYTCRILVWELAWWKATPKEHLWNSLVLMHTSSSHLTCSPRWNGVNILGQEHDPSLVLWPENRRSL